MSNITNSEDTNVLYEILLALKGMQSQLGYRDAAGNQRVSGAVTTSGTISTVTTVTGQTNVGGYSAAMQEPSLINANAQRIYAQIVRS